MKAMIFQAPYPMPGESIRCIEWQKKKLESLRPGETNLLLLHENSNCTGAVTREEMLSLIHHAGAELVEVMRETATRAGALLLAGVITEDAQGVLRNQMMMITPEGEVSYPYSKNHCVQPELDKGIKPGRTAEIFEYRGIRFAAGICFDFYFPELFIHYAKMRPDVIVMASHQRQEPEENLEFLSRARAFDCGCSFLRSAPAMPDPAIGGRSLAAGPDGKILANAGGEPGVIAFEFNPKARLMRPASYGEPDRVGDYREVIQNACHPELYH